MPILDARTVEFISRNADQTRRAGMRLGALIRTGDVICLSGDLGSGKTTLAQGICAGWGSSDQVTSPTFVLVNVYQRLDGNRLFHLDAYRINSVSEAFDLDLDGYMEQGTIVIEWADRIHKALPPENLWIELSWIDVDQRDMVISAHGKYYQDLLMKFRNQVYGVG